MNEQILTLGLDWLQPFCTTDDSRRWLNAPFTIGEFTYATDGRILVRVPKIPGVADCDPAHVAGVLNVASALPEKLEDVWVPFLEASLPAVRTVKSECEDCRGSGRREDAEPGECDDWQCDSCGGTGHFEFGVRVKLGNKYLGAQYLAKMCALPGLEIAPTHTTWDKGMPFRFTGGLGILMPMQRP